MLLLSMEAPEPRDDSVYVRATKVFSPVLKDGQWLRFHLTANPVKTIRDGDGRLNRRGEIKSCRVPLIQADQQEKWLRRKLGGVAKIHTVEISTQQPLYFRTKGSIGKIVPVLYEGVLIVEDPNGLLERVRQGLGAAKAFGCGLLSLAPA